MASETRTEGGIFPRGFSQSTEWPWPLVKAKELVLLEYGRALRDSDRSAGAIPVYGTNGRCGWHNKALHSGPGVILGRKGQGPLGVEWCSTDYWVIDTAYSVARTTQQLNLRYFYYLVKHIGLNHLKDGTSNPGLSRTTFGDLLLPLPPLDSQRSIALVLAALDDKIDLNHQMNETLESMAQALFKSWFVDFDPVRAKAEGRATGLPESLSSLFPSSLEDSEIGEVPQGWSVVPLTEGVEVNPLRQLHRGEAAPYLDMANMPTAGHAPDSVTERPFGSGMRFRNGDTLVARITPCLENGKTAYVDFLKPDEVGWGSTEYIVLRSREPLPTEYTYYLARSTHFREFAIQSMTGTSGRQRVPVEALPHFKLALPRDRIAFEFGKFVSPIMQRIRAAVEQSKTLSAIRDTLLPKLISGELRIPDVERIVGGHSDD